MGGRVGTTSTTMLQELESDSARLIIFVVRLTALPPPVTVAVGTRVGNTVTAIGSATYIDWSYPIPSFLGYHHLLLHHS